MIGRSAFLQYVAAQQRSAAIPENQRIDIQTIQASTVPKVFLPRKKTLPIVILLAVFSATFGLAFVLENLRPRAASVAIAPSQVPAARGQGPPPARRLARGVVACGQSSERPARLSRGHPRLGRDPLDRDRRRAEPENPRAARRPDGRLAALHHSLLRWHSLLGLIVVVVLFIPIGRYHLPGSLPFNLELYRVVVALVVLIWLTSLLIDRRVTLRRRRSTARSCSSWAASWPPS